MSFEPNPNKYPKGLNNGPFIKIDSFIFHHLFFFVVYISTIINNWYPLHKKHLSHSIYNEIKQCNCNCCCKSSRTRGKSAQRVPALCDHDPPTPLHAAKKNGIIINNPAPTNSNIIIAATEPDPQQKQPDERKENDIIGHKLTVTETEMITLSPSNLRTKPATDTHLDLADHRTLVSYTEFGDNKMDLSQLQVSLNRINSKGQVIGRRGAVKPIKIKKTPSKMNQNVFTIVEYGATAEQPTEQKLTFTRDITDYNTNDNDQENNLKSAAADHPAMRLGEVTAFTEEVHTRILRGFRRYAGDNEFK